MTAQTGQHADAFRKTITKTLGCTYLLYLPPEYGRDDRRWPLMLFLHGAGERGDDLELVKRHGPPKLVARGRDLPFIVVSPQCAPDAWWSNDILCALLDEIMARYGVDTDRVYVTGLSMGGYGTWELATACPERFAAIAPVCGGGHFIRAQRLKHVPAWVFHGAKDDVVPVEKSGEMVRALTACGGSVKFTVYPDAAHDSWTQTYDNPELYDWFLEQRRPRVHSPT